MKMQRVSFSSINNILTYYIDYFKYKYIKEEYNSQWKENVKKCKRNEKE